jgi:hypothetical protein
MMPAFLLARHPLDWQGIDRSAASPQPNVRFQHFAKDPERRGIDHVVKVFCGTHHLPDAYVGVRDDAGDETDNRNVRETLTRLFDSLHDRLIDADYDEFPPDDLQGP